MESTGEILAASEEAEELDAARPRTVRGAVPEPRPADARDPRRPRRVPARRPGPRVRRPHRRRPADHRRRRPPVARPLDPVRVNRAITDFVDRTVRPTIRPNVRPNRGRTMPSHTWTRGANRRKQILYVSSPIGLGHVRRDLAIVDELRQLDPDLQVDWLAQDPVTSVLEREGETIHPASEWLAVGVRRTSRRRRAATTSTASRRCAAWTRSSSPTSCCSRRSSRRGCTTSIVGDEAWDVDHYWHENPELKRGATRVADRLRRLPPDARRRRPRGVPHRRLQRRDDRTRRQLPAHPRPVDLRRQPERRRTRLVRPRPARRSATGPRRTSTSPATSPASRLPRPTRSPSGEPSSGTATTS